MADKTVEEERRVRGIQFRIRTNSAALGKEYVARTLAQTTEG